MMNSRYDLILTNLL